MQYLSKNKYKAIPRQSWGRKPCRVTSDPIAGMKTGLCLTTEKIICEADIRERSGVFIPQNTEWWLKRNRCWAKQKYVYLFMEPFQVQKKKRVTKQKDNLEKYLLESQNSLRL